MRFGVPLVSCAPVPLRRLAVVLCYPPAVGIHKTKVDLAPRVPLLCDGEKHAESGSVITSVIGVDSLIIPNSSTNFCAFAKGRDRWLGDAYFAGLGNRAFTQQLSWRAVITGYYGLATVVTYQPLGEATATDGDGLGACGSSTANRGAVRFVRVTLSA